jgi:hypothetical protein
VIPPFRKYAASLFRELISFSGSKYIECQSNDLLLSAMLNEFSRDVRSDVVLFESHSVTKYDIPNSVVRPTRAGDQVFEHTVEPLGDYVLEVEGEIVATGEFMLHYNVPFADLYMEVRKDCRRQDMELSSCKRCRKPVIWREKFPRPDAKSKTLRHAQH